MQGDEDIDYYHAWERPPLGTRGDIVGIRTRNDGGTEYLMHNEALCLPYYISASVPREAKFGD